MKRITTVMLTICLLVACFSMSALAADGKIMFTDPATKVGETVEITGVVQKSSGNFGKIEITMKYDTELLKFVSGDGITESEAGKITYVGDATHETGERKEFKFSFTALKAGTTKIEITDSTIKNVSGAVLDYTKGSSTIQIAAGEGNVTTEPTEPTTTVPSDTGVTVDVDGVTYTISNEFPEDAIPKGYEAAKLDYDMVEYNAVFSGEFGLYLVYLINEENAGDFFMYVEEDATFAPYEQIVISESTTIALLTDVTDVALPEEYKVATVVLNDHEFPAWQSEDTDGFCILYALNNQGEKSLYQLDNVEGTYQRFIAPEVETEELDNSFIGKLSQLLENHLDYAILGTGLGFILFIIIIIVLGVKLYNRNAELDEIYDEYGIDIEDSEETEGDVTLDLDENEEESEDDDKIDENEAELLVQEGLKEMFSDEEVEDVQEDVIIAVEAVSEKVTTNTIEIPIEKVVENVKQNEDTLGEALAKQVESQKEVKEEHYDNDDDDFLESFSMEFSDLDD